MTSPSRKACSIRPAEESLRLESTIKKEKEEVISDISLNQADPGSKSLDPIVNVENGESDSRAPVFDFEDLKMKTMKEVGGIFS